MKFSLALLACIAISFYSFSQTIPENANVTDAKGLRQGKWTLWYDAEWKPVIERSKAVHYRLIEYVNDKPFGIVRDYYSSGNVQWEGMLLQDRPGEIHDGVSFSYRKDGSVENKKQFNEGVLLKETYLNLDGSEAVENWASLNSKGESAYNAGNYNTALDFFEKAHHQAKKEFDHEHPDYARSMINLAVLYDAMGQYDKAEILYVEAKNIREKALGKEHPYYATAVNNLARLYNSMGHYDKAEPLYLEAKNIREKVLGKEHPSYASSLNNLAGLYHDLGLDYKAKPLFEEAKNIKEKVLGKEHPSYANSLNNLAGLYHSMGLYNKAEPLYVEAKNIVKKVLGKEHPSYATLLSSLGVLYSDMGLYDRAEPLHIEAKNIHEKVLGNEHPVYALSLNNLAFVYNAMGLYDKAEPLYVEAKNIREKALGREHADYAQSLNNLAWLYYVMGLFGKAEPLYVEAKNIREKVLGSEHRDYASSLNSLGLLYNSMGFYDKAQPLYVEAKSIRERVLGKDHPSYPRSLNNLAWLCYDMGLYNESIALLLESSRAMRSQIQRYFPSLSESEKELFYASVKITFELFSSYIFSVATEPSVTTGDVYNVQLATKALLFSANNKVRQRILSSKNDSLIYLYTDLQRQRNELAKAYQLSIQERKNKNIDITVLEEEINTKEKLLSLQSEEFAETADNKQYTWQDVQKKLKKNEATIELIRFRKYGIYRIVTDSSDATLRSYKLHGLTDTVYYVALIVMPQSKFPEPVLFVNGNDLEGRFLKNYKNSMNFKLSDTLSYNQFWQPVAKVLKKNKIKKVYLSSDGVYNSVNLNTLQSPVTGKYIADELDIRLVTNTKDLVTRKAEIKKSKATNASLFGYPDYSGTDTTKVKEKERSFAFQLNRTQFFFPGGTISSLPGTKAEIQNVTELLTINQVKASEYLDRQATEEEVKLLDNPKILHIATHGFFLQDEIATNEQTFAGFETKAVKQNPLLRSGLLLANAQQTVNGHRNPDTEDGILTAYEAMNLSLDETDLAVLSACETGLGEIRNGEGVYGLQRAFQTAGAKSVLMSLWKVDDNATQELMTSFYKHWLKSGDKREAFKKAQATVRSKYKHPYYWGAFVLVGE